MATTNLVSILLEFSFAQETGEQGASNQERASDLEEGSNRQKGGNQDDRTDYQEMRDVTSTAPENVRGVECSNLEEGLKHETAGKLKKAVKWIAMKWKTQVLHRSVRFEKSDVHRLLVALNLPEYYRYRQGTKSTGMEALLILLRRLSYPNRWYDRCPFFGRTEAELSIIFNMSVVTPNGLLAHLFGPIEGKRHDAFMLAESGLTEKLAQFMQPNGQPYVIYGDPAYGMTQTIIAPFRGAQITPQQHNFNKSMSKVRVSVEWAFGKITQYFTYVDFKRNSKILLQPVAKY